MNRPGRPRSAAFALAVAVAATITAAAGCASRAQITSADEQGAALRLDLARVFVDKGAHEAAAPLLRRFLAEHPRHVPARVLFAVVLRELGLYPQAETELETARRQARAYAPVYAELGVLYDLTRRPGLAERAHARAVSLDPNQAEYWNNLGFSRYVAGRTDEAVGALERALALDPGLVVARNNLGFAYGRLSRFDDALRAFTSVVGEARAHLNMAIVYEQLLDMDAADEARARAFEIDPRLRGQDDS
jgi:protein O-GlcNAc transferase